MSKTMCKTKDPEKRAKKQADPKFVCAKCGKKVNKEKHVRPRKITAKVKGTGVDLFLLGCVGVEVKEMRRKS